MNVSQSVCYYFCEFSINPDTNLNCQKINSLILKTFFIFILLSIFLFASTVKAADFNISVGPDGISGYSNGAKLKDVLAVLSQKTGYQIYLNEKLSDTPTSFYIANRISNEKAIKLIVQPNNHVMVFGLNENKREPDILEVKVYPRSGKSGSYIPLHNSDVKIASYSSSKQDISSFTQSESNDSGRVINAEKYKDSMYGVEKSAFGTPVLKKKNGEKGPDYSLRASGMKKAYTKYMLDKKRYEHRVASSQNREGYLAAQRQKQEYMAKRQQVYRDHVKNNIDHK